MKVTRRDFIAGAVAAAAMPATSGVTATPWPYDVSGGLADVIDRAVRLGVGQERMAQNKHQQFRAYYYNQVGVSEHWALLEQWGNMYREMHPVHLATLLQWLDNAARHKWLYERIAQEAYGDYYINPLNSRARRRLLSESDNAGRPTVFYFEHRQTGERVPLTGMWLYEFYGKYAGQLAKSQNA